MEVYVDVMQKPPSQDACSYDSLTPLFCESTDLSKTLLWRSAEGDTLLHIAIIFNQEEVVKKVLASQPDPALLNLKNHLQQTPLHLAVLTRQPNMVRALVTQGAWTGARDRRGDTPLHSACRAGCLDVVQALVPHTLPTRGLAELLNYDGDSALHLAAREHHLEVLQFLLLGPARANVNIGDGRSGRNILHHAAESGDMNLVQFLVEQQGALGLQLLAETYDGHTAAELDYHRKKHAIYNLIKDAEVAERDDMQWEDDEVIS